MRATGNGVVVGKRYVEKSARPAAAGATAPQAGHGSGVLKPKKMLVRSNAMGSIEAAPVMAAAPTMGGQAGVAKAAPGSWKTIDQRERSQMRARRQHRRGYGNAVLGSTVALSANAGHPGSIRRAAQVGRFVAGKDRPQALRDQQGRIQQVTRVPWRFSDEPVRVGLRRRGKYLRRVAHSSPRTAVAGGGLALAGYGATQIVRGRVKEAYQQRRINARRKANAARTTVGKADRYYDPEDRRQRRLGAAAAAGGLVGAHSVYRGGRGIAEDTKHLRAMPVDFAQPRNRGRFAEVTERHRATRAAANFVRAGRKYDKPILVRPSRLGRVGVGAGLLAGSAELVRHGNDPRRRRWN